MSLLSFMHRVINAAWHRGPIHEPAPDGDYFNWRAGVADCFDVIRADVISLKWMRDPSKTPRFEDLERDFGQDTVDNVGMDTRVKLLNQKRYRKKTTGNVTDVQAALDTAGFNLFAYNNSPIGPPVDPAVIMNQNFQMQALGGNHYAGNSSAYAGSVGGYWLVNGEINTQVPGVFGAGQIWAGGESGHAGYYENFVSTPVDYPTPTDPEDWCFVIFIGGVAEFDPVTNQILSIQQGLVPIEQKRQLETIILSMKGTYNWAGMVVSYT